MNNHHVEHELVAYLDGELTASERARVERHLRADGEKDVGATQS